MKTCPQLILPKVQGIGKNSPGPVACGFEDLKRSQANLLAPTRYTTTAAAYFSLYASVRCAARAGHLAALCVDRIQRLPGPGRPEM